MTAIAGKCALVERNALLCASRAQPADRCESALLESARTYGGKQDPGSTRWLGTKPPRPSSLDPLPLPAAEIAITFAGRLPLSGDQPT